MAKKKFSKVEIRNKFERYWQLANIELAAAERYFDIELWPYFEQSLIDLDCEFIELTIEIMKEHTEKQ